MLKLGKITLNIEWPSEFYLNSNSGNKEFNTFSIITGLSFNNFKMLLTGDIAPGELPAVLALDNIKQVDILKIPHHGSKYGLTAELLEQTRPVLALISVGAKNPFGHPHPETLKLLSDRNIKTLRTDQLGDIEVISDGEKWWVK